MHRTRVLLLAVGTFALVSGAGCLATWFPSVPTATPPPAEVVRGEAYEFESYLDPNWGFRLSIPKSATVSVSDDTRHVLIDDSESPVWGGSFRMVVEVVPEADAATPEALLQQVLQDVPGRSMPREFAVDGGRLPAAMVSFDPGAGRHCEQRRAVAAGYLASRTGFVVRIETDAPDRCDATALPEIEPVIESFRAP